MPTSTASKKTALQLPSGQLMTVDDFENLVLVPGTDEVFRRGWPSEENNFPFQGDMFYEGKDMRQAQYTMQTTVGMGNVPRNNDAEPLPYDVQGMGFSHTLMTYIYRMAATWTRELVEDNLYPDAVGDNAGELLNGSMRTVEEIMADGVNRALGDGGSGAPFLCEDGMYWIDSGRPNPTAIAGEWSNLEGTGALSASLLFTAQLAFRQYRNARGFKNPLKMTTIFIRPNEEQTMMEILQSPQRPTDSTNAINWAHNRFGYEVYDHMTTQQILYKAEGARNEVYQLWRDHPATMPLGQNDPDRFGVRTRFRFGIGAARPATWRGGLLS